MKDRIMKRGRKVNLTVAKNIYKNGLKSLWNGHQIG